jgi:hypothetical protein
LFFGSGVSLKSLFVLENSSKGRDWFKISVRGRMHSEESARADIPEKHQSTSSYTKINNKVNIS